MTPADKRDGVPVADVSEERLHSILDDAPIMVYVYGSEGRLLFGNREFERVLGVDRDALIGKTRDDFFSPEDAAVHRCPRPGGAGKRPRIPPGGNAAPGRRRAYLHLGQVPAARPRRPHLRRCGYLHRHHRAQACRGGDASQRRAAGRGAGHLPRRQLGVGHRRRPDRLVRRGVSDTSARLRRGSLPTTMGSSAGCIRTIAGRSSGRSTTR